jgi:copper transport protein
VLKGKPLAQRTRALLTTLSSFSPLAIAGVVIMAVTGPFNATVHLNSVDQLVTTLYGRALLFKIGFVGALLVTSTIHVRFLRPRLKKTFDAYQVELAKASSIQESKNTKEIEDPQASEDRKRAEDVEDSISQDIHALEKDVARRTTQLNKVLRWEPVLGVAVLICTGWMNVFGGTLQPVAVSSSLGVTPQSQLSPTQSASFGEKGFKTIAITTDNQFTLLITITPDSPGPNVFTIQALDGYNKQVTNIAISLSLSADTGTTLKVINFQPDGKGSFTAQANLPASGYWTAYLQVRAPDNTLHNASTTVSW